MKYKFVKIDIEKKALIREGVFTNEVIPFSNIKKVSLRSMATLFDEIGVDIMTDYGNFFVKELDPNFLVFVKTIVPENELPENWYAQVEQGSLFSVEINS